MKPFAIRSVVSAIGLTVAVVAATALPIGYCVVSYVEQARGLVFKARLNAWRLAKFAEVEGAAWADHPYLLLDLTDFGDAPDRLVTQRIVEADGTVVAMTSAPLRWPVIERAAPIMLEGRPIGSVTIASSLSGEVMITAAIAVITLVLGIAAWFAVRVLPLRVLDETLDRLQRANDEISELNRDLERRVEKRTAKLQKVRAELLQAERLSALGQLTATVAHELRNPLSAIRNTLYAVEEATKRAGLVLERPLSRIERSISRCDKIISDLLNDARVRELKRQRIAIDRWLGDVVDDQKLPATIEIARAFGAEGVLLQIDADRLRQVIVNLLENAVQAMTGAPGAPSPVQTPSPAPSPTGASVAALSIATEVVGDRLEIRIADSGPGIPSEALEKVFEPLFSTKTFGTGLGLPTVRRIVEQHGGGVSLGNRPDGGAIAVVWLPLADEERLAA